MPLPGHDGVDAREREWIVARFSLPVETSRQGARPDMVLFLAGPEWDAIAARAFMPHELAGGIGSFFEEAVTKPAGARGAARRPTVVRTSCAETAALLRAAIGPAAGVDVVCAPTPEADRIMKKVLERLAEEVARRPARGWVREGVSEAEVAGYFAAAAAYHHARPWEIFGDAHVFLSIGELGADRWVMALPPVAEGGLFLFPNPDLLPKHYARLDFIERSPDLEPPPPIEQLIHVPTPKAEIDAFSITEIEERRWELASPDAYPQAGYVDVDGDPTLPSGDQLVILEAAMRAATQVAVDRRAQGKGLITRLEGLFADLEVSTSHGHVVVTFVVPPQHVLDAVAAAKRSLN